MLTTTQPIPTNDIRVRTRRFERGYYYNRAQIEAGQTRWEEADGDEITAETYPEILDDLEAAAVEAVRGLDRWKRTGHMVGPVIEANGAEFRAVIWY